MRTREVLSLQKPKALKIHMVTKTHREGINVKKERKMEQYLFENIQIRKQPPSSYR